MTPRDATCTRLRARARRPGRLPLFVLGLALSFACAVDVPPSGGPEDKTGPTVVATVPAPDSTGVDPASSIRIAFSERINRARVERSVSVYPPITIGSVNWEGADLVITPEAPLQRDTTYLVSISPGYRDAHNVPATQRFEFGFATGATLDTARIEGTVRFKREPAGKAVVRCYRLPREADFDPLASRPDREVATSRDGTYRVRYLPSNDARFLLVAFMDNDGNGTFTPASEPSVVLPDTIMLTHAVPVVVAADMTIIDPREPSVVRGGVTNETGIDSVGVSVALLAPGDTTRTLLYTLCDSVGAYEFARVTPGGYIVRAFLDLRADSAWGDYECADTLRAPCLEPRAQLPDTLVVGPASTIEVPHLVLRKREEP